ncbi:putative 2og-fe oxygenase superfamily protein [Diplodia seriata]|uniref:Putative 2og-fe oxygenase superfamily protein n=1 Tax=Diplodia seriata TaxID=420778 RepID=A0A0G2E4K5_9PEZI|nr:putative 2og-fe oxygenase superfamily protein [Diplodia seriata]
MAEIVDLGSASESESEAAYSDVSSSCDVDPWEVRANLVDLLDNVKSPGTFAFSMNLKTDFVDPKITVGGVGPVQLPLTPDAARAIAQACHQAPFGRGEETVVDPSVRNTWELNPGNFSIAEPNWNDKFLPKVLRVVGNELGVFSNCRSFHCELYKMLLYEQGAMFKPHREYVQASDHHTSAGQ